MNTITELPLQGQDYAAIALVSDNLRKTAILVNGLAETVRKATLGPFGPNDRAEINPEVFFREVRPWCNGGKWTYAASGSEGCPDQILEFGGPSAGQSSLIHAIDLFLGMFYGFKASRATDLYLPCMQVSITHLSAPLMLVLVALQP